MTSANSLLTRRSMRARLGRNVFIVMIIMAGVSFVMGSFVLAGSLRSAFSGMFTTLTERIDLQVRAVQDPDSTSQFRDPVPESLVDEVAAIDGIAIVESTVSRPGQLLSPDGELIATQGAPTLVISWPGPETSLSNIELRAGRAPAGPGELVVDRASADKGGIETGDDVTLIVGDGPVTMNVVGIIGLPEADGFGGAVLTLTTLETAQDLFDATGQVDVIDIGLMPGADPAAVQAAIADILPPRVEVITGDQVTEEAAGELDGVITGVQTGLLIFAFITAFVSAFIINNIFGITISQRLRELALLRSVGANTKQVRRLIITEALMISVIATALGIVAGLGVARLLIWIFSQAGGGFPPIPLLFSVPGVIISILVGVGITLISVLVPAIRASRIPPVAAMQPEVGFDAISSHRRITLGAAATIVGAAAFLVGMLVRVGGTWGMILLGGGGALAVFLGIGSLSAAATRPIVGAIGVPLARWFKVPGRLAVDNARRAPRRTARTASALMIGVALISAAAVFASSLRDTFFRLLDRSISADFILADSSFIGLPSQVAAGVAQVDGVDAVSGVTVLGGRSGDTNLQIFGVEPDSFPKLVNLDVTEGGFDRLHGESVILHQKLADDLGVTVGDTLDITWENESVSGLTVVGEFADVSLGARAYTSHDELSRHTGIDLPEFTVMVGLADGADIEAARVGIEAAVEGYPQITVQDNADFRAEMSSQINQLLVMISALLGMSMVIAVLGIAITMALSVHERTREIGLLRAVGMTRRQLRRTIRWESVIVSVFGAIVGVVVGMYLGVVAAIAVPNDIIDGLTVPWPLIVIVLIGAMIAGVTAAIWPARGAARADILEAIATE